MDKKKRSKCETSHRKVFTVNEANPKEKVIYDFLYPIYNESDAIKNILYEYIISNNLQTAQHSVNILQTLCNDGVNNNAKIYTTCINNSANECKESISDNTTYNNEEKNIANNDFNINLDNIEEDEIEVEHDHEEEINQATNNALDFIKNGF